MNRTPGDNGTQPQAGAGSVGRARRSPDWLTGVIMVAPVALLIAVFFVYSTYRAVYQSTRIESPIFKPRFVGLQNYRDLLDGRFFRQASENSLVFVFTVVPVLLVLGVLVALLLNEPFRGNTALRIGMILPWALPAAVAGLVWKWIFLDSWGALNGILGRLGVIDAPIGFLSQSRWAKLAVVVVFVWTQLPLASIFLLAAVQSISPELYEAAELDGAGALGRFRTITLPGIRPMLLIVALFELLMAFTNFDLVYALTQGGPGTATTLVSYFAWAESFRKLNFGAGAAMAIMIAIAALVVILVLMRAMPKGALVDDSQ
ncbi:MAG: sugar ABC transporter permease [Thermomicrobiales bacterium]|nr:sugar ABC transporter permease [Thermomicrobiales bacterium]